MYRIQNLLGHIVKQYVSICRLKTYPNLNVLVLKSIIKNRLLEEKYLLLKNCEFEKFKRHLKNIIEKSVYFIPNYMLTECMMLFNIISLLEIQTLINSYAA